MPPKSGFCHFFIFFCGYLLLLMTFIAVSCSCHLNEVPILWIFCLCRKLNFTIHSYIFSKIWCSVCKIHKYIKSMKYIQPYEIYTRAKSSVWEAKQSIKVVPVACGHALQAAFHQISQSVSPSISQQLTLPLLQTIIAATQPLI